MRGAPLPGTVAVIVVIACGHVGFERAGRDAGDPMIVDGSTMDAQLFDSSNPSDGTTIDVMSACELLSCSGQQVTCCDGANRTCTNESSCNGIVAYCDAWAGNNAGCNVNQLCCYNNQTQVAQCFDVGMSPC